MFIGANAMRLTNKIPANVRMTVFAVASMFLFAIPVLFPGAYLQAEERPRVQVNFQFEGRLFDRITTENRALIKSRAEEKVCELAEARWGFLDWSNELSPAQSAAVWNITLSVEARQIPTDSGGTTLATIATLRHSGQIVSDQFSFQQTEENETIYPLGRTIPFTDPQALGDDVSTQIGNQLVNLLESLEVWGFLENIPIVDRVIADADEARIFVPLKNSDLRTDVDSILRVKFKSSDNKSGSLDLETSEEVSEEGQYTGYVRSRVMDLRLSPITIATPTWWDPQLLTIIGSASEVKVYMETYNANLAPGSAAVDGIVSDPE
jgi:hypothetical protein